MADSSLREYRAKRHPGRTPEPFGAVAARPEAGDAVGRYVVQQHAARRLHWDFRLEITGVLASWAVPRGPSIDPKERRLAVQTEDHPLEYADFEGIIPPGNYGAGAVIVWDTGRYRTADGVPAAVGLERGKLDIEIEGHKLRGRWALVRTKKQSPKDWLLFKKAEASLPATPEPVAAAPASVFSGLTVAELRAGITRSDELAAMARASGAGRRVIDPATLSPMLATAADEPFSGEGWLFELKYDGVRTLVVKQDQGRAQLLSRNRRDVTATFPEIALAATHLPCPSFVLDGEIAALDERGATSFERLQRRLALTASAAIDRAALEVPVILYCFDVLAVAGYDVRALPLLARKEILRRLVPRIGVLRATEYVERDGKAFFAAIREHDLEGMIAKRGDSAYATGRRSKSWLKVRDLRTADLAVVGWVRGKGTRGDLGSLMLAWRDGDAWTYAGNVGSGFDAKTISDILALLAPHVRRTAAFDGLPPGMRKNAVFVEPEVLAEVRYREVTSAGLLRQPVFLRLRDDKPLSDCNRLPARRDGGDVAPPPVATERAPLRLTNLDKVFWPEEGYTKGNLLEYYRAIWPALEPYLQDRPVVLTRYPDGIAGKSFFQKDAPGFTPDWVPTYRIEDNEYFVCNDLDALLYVINLGCIPLHIWSSRCRTLERPDWAILDLDPKGAPFRHVVRVARIIRDVLLPLDVPHFVKTSGQDGLHVLVPLGAALTHDESKTFSEILARVVVERCGDVATVARPLGERGGKVYVDFLQNGFGKTIAAPFSVRPRPGAPVSTPLAWSEVTARLQPGKFTIRTVPSRFRRRRDPMRAVLEQAADVGRVLAALESSGLSEE